MKRIVVLLVMISMMLISCDGQPEGSGENAAAFAVQENSGEAPSAQLPAEEVQKPEEEITPEESGELSASTEPVEVSFTAADGTVLDGMYYPSRYMDSPVVVLMHQANMNMHQWDAIAPWLQNAGEGQAAVSAYHAGKLVVVVPWQDSSWFPVLDDDFSVSVFTFTFRGCDNGCSRFEPQGWVLDATAALEKAASMPEVDASRVIPVGTSIGADGAVDGCISLDEGSLVNCLDSFSLSPGSYLEIPYDYAVETAIQAGRNQNCFATEGDTPSASTCRSVEMEGFYASVEEGSEHGIEMINPDHEVNILEILRDYLVSEVL
jgi:hypothetical protein